MKRGEAVFIRIQKPGILTWRCQIIFIGFHRRRSYRVYLLFFGDQNDVARRTRCSPVWRHYYARKKAAQQSGKLNRGASGSREATRNLYLERA